MERKISLMAQTHEHRIYLDDREAEWAIVDQDDYAYFSRWRWNMKRGRTNYARRAIGNGAKKKTLYLHVEIMKRWKNPPSEKHCTVDHRNGNSLDCRKKNLRWATIQQNNRNVNGVEARQLYVV